MGRADTSGAKNFNGSRGKFERDSGCRGRWSACRGWKSHHEPGHREVQGCVSTIASGLLCLSYHLRKTIPSAASTSRGGRLYHQFRSNDGVARVKFKTRKRTFMKT